MPCGSVLPDSRRREAEERSPIMLAITAVDVDVQVMKTGIIT